MTYSNPASERSSHNSRSVSSRSSASAIATGLSFASSSGPAFPKIDSALAPATSTHGNPQAIISFGIKEKFVIDRDIPTVASE